MKLILTALFAALTFSAYADNTINPGHPTDLKSTVAEMTARYGKPIKIEAGWYGAGVSYTFHPYKGFYVYATTNPAQTLVEDVIYSQFSGRYGEISLPFSKAQKSNFIAKNSDSHVQYWGDYTAQGPDMNWDGTEEIKHLGVEGRVIVRYDLNWTNDHSIVAKETENGGFQVRTKNQFDVEQPYVKSLRTAKTH
jgi:hypothetical protein